MTTSRRELIAATMGLALAPISIIKRDVTEHGKSGLMESVETRGAASITEMFGMTKPDDALKRLRLIGVTRDVTFNYDINDKSSIMRNLRIVVFSTADKDCDGFRCNSMVAPGSVDSY